jgi:hypothetical protein
MMPLLMSLTEAHPNGNSHTLMYKPDMTQTNEVLSDLGGFVGFPAKFLESHNSFPPIHVNVQARNEKIKCNPG